jgi:SAM-dependent methyltransferase
LTITAGRPRAVFESRLRWAIDGASDVLDIGTDKRFSKELRALEPLFSGKNYRAAGYHPSLAFGTYNCDLDLDVCNIALPDESFDCVICLEVLEHVTDPFAAARELRRILRPGGTLFLTTPFLTGYHGHETSMSGAHDDFPDFWRFTHQGLERLFSDLDELEVCPLDGPIEFRLRVTPLARAIDRFPLRNLLDRVDRPRRGKAATRHLVTGRKPLQKKPVEDIPGSTRNR